MDQTMEDKESTVLVYWFPPNGVFRDPCNPLMYRALVRARPRQRERERRGERDRDRDRD